MPLLRCLLFQISGVKLVYVRIEVCLTLVILHFEAPFVAYLDTWLTGSVDASRLSPNSEPRSRERCGFKIARFRTQRKMTFC